MFFCLLLFEGAFTSFFKDNKSKRSHKTVGIKVFLTIFACWEKDPDPDPGGPETLWILCIVPSVLYLNADEGGEGEGAEAQVDSLRVHQAQSNIPAYFMPALYRKSDFCFPRNETARPCSQFPYHWGLIFNKRFYFWRFLLYVSGSCDWHSWVIDDSPVPIRSLRILHTKVKYHKSLIQQIFKKIIISGTLWNCPFNLNFRFERLYIPIWMHFLFTLSLEFFMTLL